MLIDFLNNDIRSPRLNCNHHRPHAVLGKLSPIEYLNKYNLEMNYSV